MFKMFFPQRQQQQQVTTKRSYTIIICIIVTSISQCNTKTLFHQKPTSHEATTTIAPYATTTALATTTRDITIGPCTWVIGRTCPDKDVKFYLYTRQNMMDRQNLHIDESMEKSNLTASHFNPRHPTKIIIHGYNSDMFLNPLQNMRQEYFAKGDYNLIFVDWSVLAPGPCYISAVHNTRHAGACVALLVERILDYGSADMHVIGFSLGAQLCNFIARNLGSFLLPRITGLDPAMPLFITASLNDKLDSTDAMYVDVIHTNALVQGKLERCGHADFYMNGGIIQPGCYTAGSNPFACSHQRAPAYFVESIRSKKGFWGWACSSYIAYLLGMCPQTNYLVEAGENVKPTTRGMFLANTNDKPPYALGKWTDLPTLGAKQPTTVPTLILPAPKQNGDPLLRQIDQWAKLDSHFNNLEEFPATPYSQDPNNGDNWTYFGSAGTNEITHELKDDSIESIEEQAMEEGVRSDMVMAVNGNGRYHIVSTAEKPQVEWREYRRNLTSGFIDNEIFKLPVLGRG